MTIDYQTFMMIAYAIVTTVTVVLYVSRLSTRVAVLEASHDSMTQDLKEIKHDVKELLRNSVHS